MRRSTIVAGLIVGLATAGIGHAARAQSPDSRPRTYTDTVRPRAFATGSVYWSVADTVFVELSDTGRSSRARGTPSRDTVRMFVRHDSTFVRRARTTQHVPAWDRVVRTLLDNLHDPRLP